MYVSYIYSSRCSVQSQPSKRRHVGSFSRPWRAEWPRHWALIVTEGTQQQLLNSTPFNPSSRAQSFNIFEPKILDRWSKFRQNIAWPRRERSESQQSPCLENRFEEAKTGQFPIQIIHSDHNPPQAFNPTTERTNLLHGLPRQHVALSSPSCTRVNSRNSPPPRSSGTFVE